MLHAVALCLALQTPAPAAQPPKTPKAPNAPDVEWPLELSTAPQFFYPFLGYNVALSVRPPSRPQLRLSALSFGLEIPAAFLRDNAARGWSWRHLSPLTVVADVFPFDGDGIAPIFFGAGVAPHLNTYTRTVDDVATSVQQVEVAVQARAGYQWFPLHTFDVMKHGPFLQAWIGPAIYVHRFDVTIGGDKFVPSALTPVFALDVGWRFQ